MDECVAAAATCSLFQLCSEPTLRKICARATPVAFPKHTVVCREGELQSSMLIVSAGRLEGTKRIDGQKFLLDRVAAGASVGANHAITQDPADITYRCVSRVKGFALESSALADVLADPVVLKEVIYSMSKEVRRQKSLLERRSEPTHETRAIDNNNNNPSKRMPSKSLGLGSLGF